MELFAQSITRRKCFKKNPKTYLFSDKYICSDCTSDSSFYFYFVLIFLESAMSILLQNEHSYIRALQVIVIVIIIIIIIIIIITTTTTTRLQQPQEQRYPFPRECAIFSCVQTMVHGCQCLGFLTCAQVSRHAIAHRGYTTLRASLSGTFLQTLPD